MAARAACATAPGCAYYVYGPLAPKKPGRTQTFRGGVCCDKRDCPEVSDQKVCVDASP